MQATQPKIVPSLFAADHTQLLAQTQAAQAGGAQHFHVDVMDGAFVPLIGLSMGTIADMRQHLPEVALHVHLMTQNPREHAEQAIAAGAQSVTFHAETTPHVDYLLRDIQARGVAAGIALNPSTKPDVLNYLGDSLRHVLLMTTNPGHPDAPFIPMMLDKVRNVRQRLPHVTITVDGGVDEGNMVALCMAGADWLVCGRAIFDGDPQTRFKALQNALHACNRQGKPVD